MTPKLLNILRMLSLPWVGAGILRITVLLGGLYYYSSTHTMSKISDSTPNEILGAGEQIIVDELSLWHQSNSGISYQSYEPMRVRRYGAEYFYRTDSLNKKFAASGSHYSEIQLLEPNGGILFLPRNIHFNTQDTLKVQLQTNKKDGHWKISVYQTPKKVAHITVDTPEITKTPIGDWLEISIPFSNLMYEENNTTLLARDYWNNDEFLLQKYIAQESNIFGLKFSLTGGQAGDSLYIDRISILKPVHSQLNTITGQLLPPISYARIIIRDNIGNVQIVNTKNNGKFKTTLAPGATTFEIIAQTSDRIISPQNGRYQEVGSYMPDIKIFSQDGEISAPPKNGAVNDAIYIYSKKYGPRIEPYQNFLIQTAIGNRIVAAAELTTNRYGYIDRDRRPANPDNAYRVMVLGGSHEMGVHLAQADIFWNEAEVFANLKTSRPVEVISASFHHAAWTSGWPAFYDLGADLKPDLVLLPMMDPGILNLSIEEYIMNWLSAAKDQRPTYQFVLDLDGKLVHKPNEPDWMLYREPMPEKEHKRIRNQYVATPYVYSDPAKEPQWVKDNIKLTITTLAEFARLAKERGTRVGILYISNYGSSQTDLIIEGGDTYDPKKFRLLINNIAKNAGIEFFDISDDIHLRMDRRDLKRVYFTGDGHMTPYGHYRYGQALGKMILSIIANP